MRLIKKTPKKAKPADAEIARGDAARDKRDWEAAARAYKAALDKNPGLAGIWVQYAHALKETGRIKPAVESYRKALEIQQDDVETYVHLAHSLKRAGELTEAVEAFAKAVELNPSDEQSLEELHALRRRMQAEGAPDGGFTGASAAEFMMLQKRAEKLEAENRALAEEIESAAASVVRLAALQAQYEEIREENKALSEERRELKEKLAETATARDSLEKERDAARAEARDHKLRIGLAREEFLRAEGQIDMIKDLFMREDRL